jgi:uncharacterized protein (UPF0335 family)
MDMDTSFEHDDEQVVGALRRYVAEIKALDAEGAEIDRKRRNLYREAAACGSNASILKAIARRKPEEAKQHADETLAYLQAIGGEDATTRFRKLGSFSQTVFGSTGWPSDEVDFDVPDADSPLIKAWGEAEAE